MIKNIRFDKFHLLLLLILFVSVLKIGLINKGFLAFPDESRYRAAGQILKSLANGDVHSAIEFLFSTKGRPGDAIVKIIPTIIQYVTSEIFGFEVYEPKNSFPVFFYNFIIYGLLLWLHYKVSLHYLKDKFLSLFSVLVFATLVVSYVSLRHADPYDASLLILYWVFYKIIAGNHTPLRNKKMALLGFVAFFGYLCYPGYVLLFLAIPMVFVAQQTVAEKRLSGMKQALFFAAGSLICLLIFEITAQLGGTSFIKNSLLLSGTIVQGSFEECFSFLFKYLVEAEGVNGIFMVLGICGFIILSVINLRRIKKTGFPDIYLVFLILFLLFMVYSAAGYFGHKVVWYARLLKQFIPFIVIISIFSLDKFMPSERIKTSMLYGLGIVLCLTYLTRLLEYKNLDYPKDIAWEYYNKYRFKDAESVFEYAKSASFMPNFSIVKKKFPKDGSSRLVFVNISGFYPFTDLNDYKRYDNPDNGVLLLKKPSCLHFKAYQFEGYGIQARKNLDAANLQIKVYRKRN